MQYIRLTNWEELQHYKDRTPPWIKLHNSILENYQFECLHDASKAHLFAIMLLASRTNNQIPADPEWIKRKICANTDIDLKALVDSGFIEIYQEVNGCKQDASMMLQSPEQNAIENRGEEKREEEKREEKDPLSGNPDAITVLTYLNEVCGTKYKQSTRSHIENINGRLSEGHTVDDCKRVIDYKHREWAHKPDQAQYLRPSTLFGNKFQGYLLAANTRPRIETHNLEGKVYEGGEL